MEDLVQRCIKAGLIMTGQRKVILQVLERSDDHPSVEEVYERASIADTSISMATVYRTLNSLDELGIVVRHDFNGKHSRFELNMEHHHHLIDLETGEVHEFINDEIERLKERIANDLGFELVDHRLELYGRRKKQ